MQEGDRTRGENRNQAVATYKGDGVKTMTTDNGGEFPVHGKITKAKKKTAVYFAAHCCSTQKGTIENANKLIRKYVP